MKRAGHIKCIFQSPSHCHTPTPRHTEGHYSDCAGEKAPQPCIVCHVTARKSYSVQRAYETKERLATYQPLKCLAQHLQNLL